MWASLLAICCLGLGTVSAQDKIASPYRPRPVVASPTTNSPRWTAPQPTPPPGPPVASSLLPVRFQRNATASEEASSEYQIQLIPPGIERISRLDSDAQLQERIRQETKERDKNEIVQFPEEPILSRDRYQGRGNLWERRSMIVEPNYVCYKKLYFQDLNAERYGWDFGPIHPLLSTSKFFYDLAMVPIHFINDPCGNDCNTGYCLPGDPVPFMWYPPEMSVKGSLVEIGVILALVAIFP